LLLRLAESFGSAQGRLLRRASLVQGRLRAEVVPFPVVPPPEILRGIESWDPMSRKRRETRAPSVIAALANSRFLTGLSARFGMTRFLVGLLA
jgi:hypothetical protein